MAKMNFKDALNKSLQVTKQYVDDQIAEKGFSGDYNDLENRPCYEDEGDIPEYLNIEIYPDTDFSDKEYIEVINGTTNNGNYIVYRKYVKLFSDITIDMINTMKEYGVFISEYEGQLTEVPLIDILDESQADQGMYSIGIEFEFILQAQEGYYLPENGLWYEESYIERDLNGNFISEYKTVNDFNGILLIKDNGKLIFIEHVLPHDKCYRNLAHSLNNIWKKVGKCNINCDTYKNIENAKFKITNYEKFGNKVFVFITTEYTEFH